MPSPMTGFKDYSMNKQAGGFQGMMTMTVMSSSMETSKLMQWMPTLQMIKSTSTSPKMRNGFGLHLVSVPGHKTTGGDKFQEKLGDMSKFDSFMDCDVVFATSSLQ